METNTSSNYIFDEFEPRLVFASPGKRLTNYLIDYLVVIVFFKMISRFYFFQDFIFELATSYNILIARIFLILLCITFHAILMGTIEAAFKGKTLGKFITKTRAVREDGGIITASTAFKRGFLRALPFCVFSAVGSPSYPWQDKWTNTYVVDEKFSMLDLV